MKKLPILEAAKPQETPERADAARNRKRILAAARKLLAKRPIGEICMDELARAAGVGKGTLYRRFVDRSSLCLALLDENERALQERVLRGFDLPATASARERLLKLLCELLAFTFDNAVLLAEAEAFHRGDRARFASPVYAWRRRVLARSIERARAAGAASPGDVELTADLLLAGITAEQVLWQLQRGRARDELAAAYAETWARLLGMPLSAT